ncbi:peroxiredoxin-6-like isoform X1 [Pollicipes pollicipes]|uniref:peroxiredoxin-6-like isoform X1 n=2 Tax=Pollicipes pollicipes TaxID=41117 RepID=UPI0018849A75|nr:peroxiredoxin-6-like isoform X1 [Pollicipes pollicipes]
MCDSLSTGAMVLLGDVFPNFEADSTEGPVKFHDWLGDSWGILFSHPADFTPVCTTELGAAAQLAPEFAKRGVRMMAVSCDGVNSHKDWIKDIEAYNSLGAGRFPYPIIADEERHLAVQLGMLDPNERTADGLCLTARAVFVVGPDKKLKLSILYPATTGRNFHEILRVIDSLQLTAQKKVATPVNWKAGDKCMVLPSISEDDAKKLFPAGVEVIPVPSGKKYLRTTPQPQ